jgi:tRNA uridine 5-carboxymethylaminomethyl modification enzyme
MFTSRAEYRLILREDNADLRLTEIGRKLGVVGDERWSNFDEKREAIDVEMARMKSTWIQPNSAEAGALESKLTTPLAREYNLADLVKRPEMTYADLAEVKPSETEVAPDVAEQVEIQIKYSGYIDRQRDEIEQLRKHENTELPEDFDYAQVGGLSNELKFKLEAVRPVSIAQANRIQGMTPAAISLLLIHLKKRQLQAKAIS